MIYLAAGGLLHVNPGLLVWTLITFLIVVAILGFFAWKPIIQALDARAEKIHGDLEKAETLRTEAEKLLASYNTKIKEAKDEALAIVNEAKTDANNLKKKMLDETQSEIKSLKDQSLKDIDLSRLKAIQDVQEKVIELSVAVAGQILEKQLKQEDHTSFVKSEIAKLNKVNL